MASMVNRVRKGRLRALGQREPNGRLDRSVKDGACSPAEVKRLRDAAIREMASPEWGSEAGRLFLAGHIDAPMFEAAKRWSALVADWRSATGLKPPSPGSSSMFGSTKGHPPDPDSPAGKERTKKDIRLVEVMAEAHGVLLASGAVAEKIVRKACEEDCAVSTLYEKRAFCRGLELLAQHWGLTPPTPRVRNSA